MGDSAPEAYALIIASLLVLFALKAGLDLTWRHTAIVFLSLAAFSIAAIVVMVMILHCI